jgi:hypothetical protein
MLNEMTEEYNRQQAQFQPQGQPHQGHQHRGHQSQDDMNDGDVAGAGEQPDVPLDDLDQGFLVGRRNAAAAARTNGEVNGNLNAADADDGVEDLGAAEAAAPVEQVRTRRVSGRAKETEAV